MLAFYSHTRLGLRSKEAKKSDANEQDDGESSNHALARLVSVIALDPLFVALWIPASRVRDDQHFPVGTAGGASLGSSLATYCHGLWSD